MSDFEICTISNIKNGNCSEDCKFCAQGTNCCDSIIPYPIKDKETLKEEYIVSEKNQILRFGLVASGRGMKIGTKEFDNLIDGIKEIKKYNKNSKICCSLGLLEEEEFMALKEAGVERYHCNIQTSPKKYHTYSATTHTIYDRLDTIKRAQKVGLEICCGGIIGMGESFEDRVDMAFCIKKLDVQGVPINILIPIKGTPYENRRHLAPIEILKTIAIYRLILKDKNIKVAAGRESILKDFLGSAFLGGANGMLVGGYLTKKGRNIEEDKKFINDLK